MTNNKPSTQIIKDLEKLKNYVIKMGSMVEQNLKKSIDSFLKRDEKLAEEIAKSDDSVNDMEIKIDKECNRIIAIRQPTAGDLRFILSMIKIVNDLERIGDGTKKIAHYAQILAAKENKTKLYLEIEPLAERVISMLNKTMDAFTKMDFNKAMEILELDIKINQEFDRISRLFISHMIENPRNIKSMLRVNTCARTLERIGDHSKNICESIIYSVKGKDIRHIKYKDAKISLNIE